MCQAQYDTLDIETRFGFPIEHTPNTQPKFPGGVDGFKKFVAHNLKYPTISKEMGVQGKVFVEFVIDRFGNVQVPKVVRGVETYVDKESIRLIRSLPKWQPGTKNGKPVNTRMLIPITFRLL